MIQQLNKNLINKITKNWLNWIEKHNYLESELEYHNKKLKKKNKGSEVEPVFSGAHRKIPIKKVNDEHERNIEVER